MSASRQPKLLSIVKPGIIFGNMVTLSGGYFMAASKSFQPVHFFFLLIGMSLIIACGCVLNNIIDRDIDGLMERTKNRLLVTGRLSASVAFAIAAVCGVLGFMALYFTTNFLTIVIAIIGLFFYVLAYSLYAKRKSNFGTSIGGISGAVPPVIGYCAVTNHLDMCAIFLFLILFFWQLPHFYAIAMYRLNDYSAASIPILPIRKGFSYTKRSILFYIVIFTLCAVAPAMIGCASPVYFGVALCLGVAWFVLGLKGFNTEDDHRWARKIFLFSIIVITLLCIGMALHF